MEPYLAALLPPRALPAAARRRGATDATQTAAAERVILALRLDRGVPERLGARQPPLAAVAIVGRIVRPAGARRARTAQARLRLTLRGRLLSNELFGRLV